MTVSFVDVGFSGSNSQQGYIWAYLAFAIANLFSFYIYNCFSQVSEQGLLFQSAFLHLLPVAQVLVAQNERGVIRLRNSELVGQKFSEPRSRSYRRRI